MANTDEVLYMMGRYSIEEFYQVMGIACLEPDIFEMIDDQLLHSYMHDGQRAFAKTLNARLPMIEDKSKHLHRLVLLIWIELSSFVNAYNDIERHDFILNALGSVLRGMRKEGISFEAEILHYCIQQLSSEKKFHNQGFFHSDYIQKLVNKHPCLIASLQPYGNTNYMTSINSVGTFLAVLIKELPNYDINTYSEYHRTLLMDMVMSSQPKDLITAMIGLGADPNLKDAEGRKSIHLVDLQDKDFRETLRGLYDFDNTSSNTVVLPNEKVSYVKEYYSRHKDKEDQLVALHCTSFVDEVVQFQKKIYRSRRLFTGNMNDYFQAEVNNETALSAIPQKNLVSNRVHQSTGI